VLHSLLRWLYTLFSSPASIQSLFKSSHGIRYRHYHLVSAHFSITDCCLVGHSHSLRVKHVSFCFSGVPEKMANWESEPTTTKNGCALSPLWTPRVFALLWPVAETLWPFVKMARWVPLPLHLLLYSPFCFHLVSVT
jgi:hypothetical protein